MRTLRDGDQKLPYRGRKVTIESPHLAAGKHFRLLNFMYILKIIMQTV